METYKSQYKLKKLNKYWKEQTKDNNLSAILYIEKLDQEIVWPTLWKVEVKDKNLLW